MNKTILVLGSSGMLGHILLRKLENEKFFIVHNLVRKNKVNKMSIICDVLNIENLAEIIKRTNPDIIVNCIGLLKEDSNINYSKAIYLNSYLPHWLLNHCERKTIKLIHISTDCVFDGLKGGYTEESTPNATDNYGRTKALGEFNHKNHLCIRTSIIGPELKEKGQGLFSWFINQQGEVDGFTESIWSGVTTLVLSDIIIECIREGYTGLVHVSNGVPISKYNLLYLIKDQFNLDNVRIKKVPGKKTNKSLNSLYKYFDIPSYEKMIFDMKNNI